MNPTLQEKFSIVYREADSRTTIMNNYTKQEALDKLLAFSDTEHSPLAIINMANLIVWINDFETESEAYADLRIRKMIDDSIVSGCLVFNPNAKLSKQETEGLLYAYHLTKTREEFNSFDSLIDKVLYSLSLNDENVLTSFSTGGSQDKYDESFRHFFSKALNLTQEEVYYITEDIDPEEEDDREAPNDRVTLLLSTKNAACLSMAFNMYGDNSVRYIEFALGNQSISLELRYVSENVWSLKALPYSCILRILS